MRSAIRGDFERLAERRGGQELMREPEPERPEPEPGAGAGAVPEPEPDRARAWRRRSHTEPEPAARAVRGALARSRARASSNASSAASSRADGENGRVTLTELAVTVALLGSLGLRRTPARPLRDPGLPARGHPARPERAQGDRAHQPVGGDRLRRGARSRVPPLLSRSRVQPLPAPVDRTAHRSRRDGRSHRQLRPRARGRRGGVRLEPSPRSSSLPVSTCPRARSR